MTVQNVLDYVNSIAPQSIQCGWDNTGLLCGDRTRPVRRILVALDPFPSVCREAVDLGADVLVTHHPLIFSAPKAVTNDTTVGQAILLLAAHGICAINAHTNLDHAPGGVNDVLAETLGLADIAIPYPGGTDAQGRPWGLLRTGIVAEQPLTDFLAHVKSRLGTPVLRYADGGKPVRKVAVGGGSSGDAWADALANRCDTLVTADVKYNQFWDAHDMGLNLIDAGHFYTENPVIPVLAQKLRTAFPDAEVLLSAHTDCMRFA